MLLANFAASVSRSILVSSYGCTTVQPLISKIKDWSIHKTCILFVCKVDAFLARLEDLVSGFTAVEIIHAFGLCVLTSANFCESAIMRFISSR